MKFNNRQNLCHNIDGKLVWESRSVAVVGVIFIYKNLIPYVLVSRRGPNAANFQGKMNLVAGYLDWNESGFEALVRESWEETGFDLIDYLNKNNNSVKLLQSNLEQPWSVNTKPSENNENVTLRYGVCFQILENESFPTLTVENNEIIGECEDPMWISIEDIDKYDWAFNHDNIIIDYYNFLHKK